MWEISSFLQSRKESQKKDMSKYLAIERYLLVLILLKNIFLTRPNFSLRADQIFFGILFIKTTSAFHDIDQLNHLNVQKSWLTNRQTQTDTVSYRSYKSELQKRTLYSVWCFGIPYEMELLFFDRRTDWHTYVLCQ